MFYFMCFIIFIVVCNLLVAGVFIWKFGFQGTIDLFSVDIEEPSKETTVDRSQ